MKLKEKQKSIDLYKSNIDNNGQKITEELNVLKLELDNKKQELESKISLCKEQMRAIELYKNDNEKMNEKIDIIRSELLLRESDYMKQIEELKLENVKLKEKIKQNEDIDDELNKLLIDNKDIINKKDVSIKNSLNFQDLKNKRFNKCVNLIILFI